MHVIAGKTLRQFWERHPDAAPSLREWLKRTGNANWKSPQEVGDDYPSASIIGEDRVTFNVKGNHYRLVVHIPYQFGQVYIRFIGTHAEYDRISATEV